VIQPGRYALRPATIADFEFLFALKRTGYRDHVVATYGEWDEEWQRNRFASHFDPAAVQVILLGGAAAGELIVEWEADPVYLVAIELLPELRGRGITRVDAVGDTEVTQQHSRTRPRSSASPATRRLQT